MENKTKITIQDNSIINSITNKSKSAKEIAKELKKPKKFINSMLYSMEKQNLVSKTDGTPPQWKILNPVSLQKECENFDFKEDIPIVMIDLGNVHDVLQQVEPYAKEKLAKVYAFADLQYNGYGIKPPCNLSVELYHSKTPDKNAADIEMVWKCADIIFNLEPNQKFKKLQFCIVTKDNGFRTLKTIIERHGHEAIFMRTWEELRVYVE